MDGLTQPRGAAAVHWLRAMRELTLRAVSPIEGAGRRLGGGVPLPPLWLRRHAGRVRDFPGAGSDAVRALADRRLIGPRTRILDLGCGPGGLPLALETILPDGARYVGLDVHDPSIAWCRRRFAGDPRFRFERVTSASPYGRSDGPPASSYRIPLEDASQDLIVARSLLTHLLEAEARHILSEIGRILAPDGRAFVTAFLYERGRRVPFLPWLWADGRMRTRRRGWPTAAVGYEREGFLSMTRSAGLFPVETWELFYPGDGAGPPRGQDVLFLARAAGAASAHAAQF